MVHSRRAAVQLEPRQLVAASPALDALHARVLATGGSVASAIDLAVELGPSVPLPGLGQTPELWSTLATIAAADVSVARVVEPHLDALAVLAQLPGVADLGVVGADGRSAWGVFAAEGAGLRVTATSRDGSWMLDGVKPWCSLAGRLSHALITAHTPGGRRLFAIDLAHNGVRLRQGEWFARGLPGVESGPIELGSVPAVPIGDDGWYLSRPGFAWGGIGVAAVWWGAAIGIARTLEESVRTGDPDQIALMHLGATDLQVEIGRLALAAAAASVDRDEPGRGETRILAQRTRSIVAGSTEEIIRRCGHAMGPAPLALDARHAGRVADLELYLRQDHAERDEAELGRSLLTREARPW
ncbi:MAG: acyl-CoA dehydrogenase [Microbacteriaceae bacterium]|nr:acyl-CoA dehydrogenase [Microbacteriaceae bacterium]